MYSLRSPLETALDHALTRRDISLSTDPEQRIFQGGMSSLATVKYIPKQGAPLRVLIKTGPGQNCPRRQAYTLNEARAAREFAALPRDLEENWGIIEQGTQTVVYSILPFHEGKTLREIAQGIRQEYSPKDARAAFSQVLYDILTQLTEFDQKGWIHRDIKPDNVIISATGNARIIDFGIAVEEGDQLISVEREQGVFTGTPRYFSPEQIENKEGKGTDYYATGLTLMEVTTGKEAIWCPKHSIEGRTLSGHERSEILITRRAYDAVQLYDALRKLPISKKLPLIIRMLLQPERKKRYRNIKGISQDPLELFEGTSRKAIKAEQQRGKEVLEDIIRRTKKKAHKPIPAVPR